MRTIAFSYAPEAGPAPGCVRLTRTLTDFRGEGNYLLVYINDETHGIVLKTNAQYTDADTATRFRGITVIIIDKNGD